MRQRLPLDLPQPQGRQRSSRYRRQAHTKNNDIVSTTSLIKKMITVGLIIALVIVLKVVDTEFTQGVLNYIRGSITDDFNVEEALGKLKFVGKYVSDVKAVFGQQPDEDSENVDIQEAVGITFTVPAEGKVTDYFVQQDNKTDGNFNLGIDILSEVNDNIYAVADGTIMESGDNERKEKYLKIDHGNNVISYYEGCSQTIVDVGYRVKKGEKMGKMGKSLSGGYILHFETWVQGQPVDPLSLMDLGK